MSTTNNQLNELAGPPRDHLGRYLLPDPGAVEQAGGPRAKPLPYSRATTVAKATEDQSGLMAWTGRITAAGMGQRPDLVKLAATTDPTDKKTLGRIAKDAQEAGGSSTGRNTGTATHTAIEAINRGRPAATGFEKHCAAYQKELDRVGLTVLPGLVERVVVNHELGIAGTFDVGLIDSGGTRYVGDLKTGSIGFPAAFAIQLAIYATAPALVAEDFQSYEPAPGFDEERGVIIHITPEGECDVHWIDLVAGQEGLALALQVRGWRKSAKPKRLLEPIPNKSVSAQGSVEIVADTGGDSDGAPPVSALLALFESRYEAIKEAGATPQLIKDQWPVNLSGPKQSGDWSREELEQGLKTATVIFDALGLPFDEGIQTPHVSRHTVPAQEEPAPLRPVATESEVADEGMIEALKTHSNLPASREPVAHWMRQGAAVGQPWELTSNPVPLNHWAICLTAVLLAVHPALEGGDDELARGWISLIVGEDEIHNHPPGALLSTFSTEEAERLQHLLANHTTFAQAVEAAELETVKQ